MKIGKLVFPKKQKKQGIKIIKSESNLYVDQIQITRLYFTQFSSSGLLLYKNLFNLYSEHVFIEAN